MNPLWISRLLPTAMIVLMAAAAVVCAAVGQWWRALYWICGALLNVSVTYGS